MLRITVHKNLQTIRLQLEGRLAAPWLKELEECSRRAVASERPPKTEVDLSGVISIDRAGKEYLETMRRRGAEFVVGDCEMKSIVTELVEKSASVRLPSQDQAKL